ncbi:MAG: hypothetical protein ACJ72N_02855 [Labedaea sp.]
MSTSSGAEDRADPPAEESQVMPTAAEAAAAAGTVRERPAAVRYAFVVWVLAGAFGIANAVDLFVHKQQIVDTWMRTKDPQVTNEQVVSSVSSLLWMLLLAAVVFTVFFTLFAYKAQEGVRRARLLLTMLCVLSVAFYFTLMRTTFGLTAALLTLIGAAMLYLPKSNEYFAPRDLPS